MGENNTSSYVHRVSDSTETNFGSKSHSLREMFQRTLEDVQPQILIDVS